MRFCPTFVISREGAAACSVATSELQGPRLALELCGYFVLNISGIHLDEVLPEND